MTLCLKVSFEILFLILVISKSTTAHNANKVPKFYAQDSTILVDTLKQSLPSSFHTPAAHIRFHPVNAYPVYTIKRPMRPTFKSMQPIRTIPLNIFKPQVSPNAQYNSDEFPNELLHIAKHKLGLKRLDEVPTISELGELLGTGNPEETMKHIKKLITTEQGIALIKAYIESTDYTDKVGGTNQNEAVTSKEQREINKTSKNLRVTEEKNTKIKHITIAKKSDLDALEHKKGNFMYLPTLHNTTTFRPSFLENLCSYLNIHNLFTQNTQRKIKYPTLKVEQQPMAKSLVHWHKQQQFSPAFIPSQTHERKHMHLNRLPLLVRPPLPYHYPIPLRPVLAAPQKTPTLPTNTTLSTTVAPTVQYLKTTSHPITTTSVPETTLSTIKSTGISHVPSSPEPIKSLENLSSVVHLNTPKVLIPHVHNLLRAAANKIPTKKIETFLQNKPKLAELAAKVTRFPIAQNGNTLIDAQLLAAVQRAIDQDEDLKELLNTKDTLKRTTYNDTNIT